MQLASNQKLAQNRVKLGTGFHISAMAVLGLGVLVSTRPELLAQYPWASPATLMGGMALFLIGQTQIRRWGPHFKQTENLQRAMRGLDDRYKLYTFMASSLPDYILVGPGGVQVLEARPDRGEVVFTRDRWQAKRSRFLGFLEPSRGNPVAEAQRDVGKVRAVLDTSSFSDVPASALVVLTDPQVSLRVEAPTVPVTRTKDLKDVLRRTAGKGQSVVLPAARVREVQRVFDERMRVARTWR